MEKKQSLSGHKITFNNERSGEKKATKFLFDSTNGLVFIVALVIIAVVVVLVTAMVGFTFSAE